MGRCTCEYSVAPERPVLSAFKPHFPRLRLIHCSHAVFQGWLVDLVNKFGSLDGFHILLERFTTGPALSVSVIAALIK
ncbi:hypothetical protein DPMN_051447 [Dreissena polymorpha]|uniref:Uncharacterized protein n=1 Tax=Dreissena polymorpha TaxID=45954 RepID=A0A9D4CJZ5_DREPO|nr:hypothetical protein DPMN_051447 [Dreissena polymorpha]